MILLRIVNAFYAALFLAMALVSLAFLSASLNDHVGAPENIWVSIGWVALFLLYAVLAFLNMRSAGADRSCDRRRAAHAGAPVSARGGGGAIMGRPRTTSARSTATTATGAW